MKKLSFQKRNPIDNEKIKKRKLDELSVSKNKENKQKDLLNMSDKKIKNNTNKPSKIERLNKKKEEEEMDVDSNSDSDDEKPNKKSKKNNDSDILFSSIVSNESKKAVKKNQSLHVLLKKAQDFQANLENLSQEEKDEVIRKKAFENSLLRAQGVKVKDDPRLLKKSLTRESALKRKSSKQWNERKKDVDDLISKNRKKKDENIRKRKNIIVAKKLKKNKKTRHYD